METKFNFNSQVATTREQSERLLALGLKKETADMIYPSYTDMKSGKLLKVSDTPVVIYKLQSCYDITAWSLHRLMILAEMKGTAFSDLDTAYETTISIIAAKIRFGYFNKEYLV